MSGYIEDTRFIDNGIATRFLKYDQPEVVASWWDVIMLLRSSSNFRRLFEKALTLYPSNKGKRLPLPDYFWKTIPVVPKKIKTTPFMMMCIFTDAFANKKANVTAFKDKIDLSTYNSVFKNLNGTSILISPRPRMIAKGPFKGKSADFLNLRRFIKNALLIQKNDFWKVLSESLIVLSENSRPFWLNTHGLDVPWLHMRIDYVLKYRVDIISSFKPKIDLNPWLKLYDGVFN